MYCFTLCSCSSSRSSSSSNTNKGRETMACLANPTLNNQRIQHQHQHQQSRQTFGLFSVVPAARHAKYKERVQQSQPEARTSLSMHRFAVCCQFIRRRLSVSLTTQNSIYPSSQLQVRMTVEWESRSSVGFFLPAAAAAAAAMTQTVVCVLFSFFVSPRAESIPASTHRHEVRERRRRRQQQQQRRGIYLSAVVSLETTTCTVPFSLSLSLSP